MKKLTAVIVVLAVLALALWLVLRDDRGPGDSVTTEPADSGVETTDTTVSDDDAMVADGATGEDGAAVVVSEEDSTVADGDAATSGDDTAVSDDDATATGEDGTAVAVSDDDATVADGDVATGEDGTAVAVSDDDATAAGDDGMVTDGDGATGEDGTAVAVTGDDDAMVSGGDTATGEDGTAVAVSDDDATAAGEDGTTVAVSDDDSMVADGDVATDEDGTVVAAITDEDVDEEAGPDFDVVRVEVTGDAVMAGVGEPGATIVVTSGDDVVGETVADADGAWVIVTEDPLDPGAHELKLSSVNGHGETVHSDTVVLVSVPQETTGDEADDVLAVMMNDEDGGDVEVIQGAGDGIGISGGGELALESLSYDEEGNVTMGGQATAGDTVVIYVDDRVAGVVDVEDGEWTVALGESVEEGTHSLRVDEINEDGDVVARLETPFVRSAFVMPDASDRLVVIQPGNNLWQIARRSYGSGILYTLIFEANRNQIADPDLIYPGQIFVMPQDKVAEN